MICWEENSLIYWMTFHLILLIGYSFVIWKTNPIIHKMAVRGGGRKVFKYPKYPKYPKYYIIFVEWWSRYKAIKILIICVSPCCSQTWFVYWWRLLIIIPQSLEIILIFSGGFINVSDVLLLPDAQKNAYTLDDVRRVVANCPKQRFALLEGPPLQIRANQGHSIQVNGHVCYYESMMEIWL